VRRFEVESRVLDAEGGVGEVKRDGEHGEVSSLG
jgi:hypothetical protein